MSHESVTTINLFHSSKCSPSKNYAKVRLFKPHLEMYFDSHLFMFPLGTEKKQISEKKRREYFLSASIFFIQGIGRSHMGPGLDCSSLITEKDHLNSWNIRRFMCVCVFVDGCISQFYLYTVGCK